MLSAFWNKFFASPPESESKPAKEPLAERIKLPADIQHLHDLLELAPADLPTWEKKENQYQCIVAKEKVALFRKGFSKYQVEYKETDLDSNGSLLIVNVAERLQKSIENDLFIFYLICFLSCVKFDYDFQDVLKRKPNVVMFEFGYERHNDLPLAHFYSGAQVHDPDRTLPISVHNLKEHPPQAWNGLKVLIPRHRPKGGNHGFAGFRYVVEPHSFLMLADIVRESLCGSPNAVTTKAIKTIFSEREETSKIPDPLQSIIIAYAHEPMLNSQVLAFVKNKLKKGKCEFTVEDINNKIKNMMSDSELERINQFVGISSQASNAPKFSRP